MSYKSTESVVSELMKQLERQGLDVERQGDSGLKIERGDEDEDAPRIVQHGSPVEPSCCETRDGAGNARRGLKISLQIGVTDRDSGSDSSGVARVCAKPVEPDGSIGFPGGLGWKTWKLTPEEQAATRDGSASHRFVGCVPCDSFHDRTVRFQVITEDAEGNISVQYLSVTVGEPHFAECCGGQ